MKTMKTIKTIAGALMMTAALALSACHPDEVVDGGGGMITVDRLEVGIESIGAATRAVDAATGREGVVKKQFVNGDVLHLYVDIDSKVQYANATYTAGTPDGTPGTWNISPAIMLPKNAAMAESIIMAFYDGKDTKYDDSDQFINNLVAASIGITINSNEELSSVTDKAGDALVASNSDVIGGNGITLSADGTLAIKLIHANALIRLSQVENKLGTGIKKIEAVVYESGMGISQTRNIPLTTTASGATNTASGTPDDYTGAEALSYIAVAIDSNTPYILTSFIVTLDDGSGSGDGTRLTIPVPDASGTTDKPTDSDGKPVTGQPLGSGKQYLYHLVLAPGMLTATLDGSNIPQWSDKGQLLTAPDGYIPLYNAEDLKKIGVETNYPLSGNYILMDDIDLSASGDWTPIGPGTATPFTGRFNGNGHTIKGMKVNTSSNNASAGFFGYISGATIYNLHFQSASVTGTGTLNNAGTLAGYAENSTLALCSATDCTVSGTYYSGGLVGVNDGSHFTRCYAINCKVTGNDSSAGGLIGRNDSGSILAACYTAGCTVTATHESSGTSYAGGLIGYNAESTLYGCYALYATATATSSSNSGDNSSGALAGYIEANSVVTSCYSTNSSSTSNKLIGAIGDPSIGEPTITGCISPLNNPGSDTSAPSENHSGITYRDGTDGYAPLTGSISDCENVRTVIVNTGTDDVTESIPVTNGFIFTRTTYTQTTIPPGGIYVVSRKWAAGSIWGTINDANKKNAPFINWSYDGTVSD